jgi:hypothetical protein
VNDDTFARLVAEEVKNKATREQKAYLMLPENWARWQRALKILVGNLQDQLERISESEEEATDQYRHLGDEGIKMIMELNSGFADRRKKIERFAYYVEQKYDEVTRMILLGTEQVDERVGMIEFYRKAIQRHRELMNEYEMDPTAIDEALWASLDGKWDFDEITEESALASIDGE